MGFPRQEYWSGFPFPSPGDLPNPGMEFLSLVSPTSAGGSAGKESTCQVGDTGDVGSIPGWGRSPGERNGNPLQYSCLGNPMDCSPWASSGKNTRVGCHALPLPGDLPNPGIEPRSPTLQVDSLPAEPQGKPKNPQEFSSGSS